jgi:hypothetical protein
MKLSHKSNLRVEEVKPRCQHFYNLVEFVEFVLEKKKDKPTPAYIMSFLKLNMKKNLKVTFDVFYKTCFSKIKTNYQECLKVKYIYLRSFILLLMF